MRKAGIIIFLFMAFISAKAQVINVNADVDSSSILIGNIFHYTLGVNYDKDLEISLPGEEDSMGVFEINHVETVDSSYQKGITKMKVKYSLTSFEPGDHVVPSLNILYRKKGDSTFKSISTDTFNVRVNLVATDTAVLAKQIKPPLEAPYTISEFLPWIIGGILLFLAIITLFLIYRKRKNRVRPEMPVKPKVEDPFLHAKKQLASLREEKLWQSGNHKDFQDRVSDILRELLERQYRIPALEMTTEEINEALIKKSFPAEDREHLLSILKFSDLVKFAKVMPGPGENEGSLHDAEEFVRMREAREKPVS